MGFFFRPLVGLDRQAAKEALARFMAGKTLSPNQIEFLDLVVNHLVEFGFVEAERLFESPFIDFSPRGVEGMFTSPQVDELLAVLAEVEERAVAA